MLGSTRSSTRSTRRLADAAADLASLAALNPQAPYLLAVHVREWSDVTRVQKILARFWGRKRWCRMKLRQVAERNHGIKLGLYRASPTHDLGRFSSPGHFHVIHTLLEQEHAPAEG